MSAGFFTVKHNQEKGGENMNKRIALSGLSVLSSVALVGGAAFAAFTATASNNGNTFGASTLSLAVVPNGGNAATPVFNFPTGITPGTVKDQAITLSNPGDTPASTVKLASITMTGGSSPNLADKLTLDIYNDVDGSGTINGGDTLQGSAHVNDPAWTNIPLGFALPASGSHQIIARITFDADATNAYQGATTSFNMNFEADQ